MKQQYFLKDRKEKPLFTYAIFDTEDYSDEYFLYPDNELEEAFLKLKELSIKYGDFRIGIYEIEFDTEDKEYRFRKTYIVINNKIIYNKSYDVELHCKFYLDGGYWGNPREKWVVGWCCFEPCEWENSPIKNIN